MAREKRRFQRYHKEVSFKILFDGETYDAKTENYSVDGLSVCVSGSPPIKTGDIVNLDIDKIKVKTGGKVMRIYPRDGGCVCLGIVRLGLIHGSIEDFETSDLLLGLQRSVKTGVIFFKFGNVQKSVYFKSGDMIFATSSLVEDRLGDMLMREGKITLDDYNKSTEVMKLDDKRHGTVLVEMGLITPNELFSAVNRSVELIILSLFSMHQGDFLFKEGELPSDELITLKLSAASLIYRGVKAIDDISTIKSKCPLADDILAFSTDPLNLFQDIEFDEMDRKVLSLVDGTRTFKETIDNSGLDPFEAMRLVSALLSTRIIEVHDKSQSADISAEDISFSEIFNEHQDEQARQTEKPAEEATARPSATVASKSVKGADPVQEKVKAIDKKLSSVEMIQRIEEMYALCEDQDYYAVLGVSKIVLNSELKKAYYMRAKEFHPDKHFYLKDDVKDMLNHIFTTITTAYSTLSSHDLRIQYDKDPMKGRSRVVDPAARAEQKFAEASDLMRKGQYDAAAGVFAEAAYLQSEMPNYHYFSGLALARAGKHREAERTMQRAIKLDPFNADYAAELGHTYLALGFNLRAKGSFEKALKLSAMHQRAMEGLSALPDE